MVPSVGPIVCSLAHRVFDFFLVADDRCAVRSSSSGTLNLLKPPLSNSVASVIIPLHDRIPVVRLLHGAEFSGRLSEFAQALDPISGFSSSPVAGEWRAPAFWQGVNQEPRRNAKGRLGTFRQRAYWIFRIPGHRTPFMEITHLQLQRQADAEIRLT